MFYSPPTTEEFENSLNSVPEQTLEKFPPTYKMEFRQTMTYYRNATNDSQKLEALKNFGNKFVLIPEMWNLMSHLEEKLLNEKSLLLPSQNEATLSKFRKKFTFSSKKYRNVKDLEWTISKKQFSDYYLSKQWADYMYEPEKLLNFPHNELDDALRACTMQSVRPIDKKVLLKHPRFRELYKEFMRDDLTFDEWVPYLKEIEDDEVIVGLIEHRLGWKKGCLDKKLWKFYMNFLEEKDQIAYLNILRRFTRFFIEDQEMVEEYRKKIEKISKRVAEFWIDTILYEFDFGTFDSTIKVLNRALAMFDIFDQNLHNSLIDDDELPSIFTKYFEEFVSSDSNEVTPAGEIEDSESLKVSKPSLTKITRYYPKNEIPSLKKSQSFSFHQTFIFYITQKVKRNPRILQKLFNCCKYFFANQPTPICHRLVISCWEPKSKYRSQSLFLNDKEFNFEGLENLYVSEIFDIASRDRYIFSKVIHRLHKCDAKFGRFFCQTVTLPEINNIPDWRNFLSFESKLIHQGVEYPCFEMEELEKLYFKNLKNL